MHWSRFITLCSSSDVTKAVASLKEEQGTSSAWRGAGWVQEGTPTFPPRKYRVRNIQRISVCICNTNSSLAFWCILGSENVQPLSCRVTKPCQ